MNIPEFHSTNLNPQSIKLGVAPEVPRPKTAEELLKLAQALIADSLLSPMQLGLAQHSPYDYLRCLVEGPVAPTVEEAQAIDALVREVQDAIVLTYFRSLLAKASEGEKYDAARLAKALLKAQITTAEALEAAVNDPMTTPADKVRIAEVLKN